MNIFVPVPLWTWAQVSLGCIPGMDYWIIFISSKYAQIVLYNGSTSVHCNQPCARALIFLYLIIAGLPLIFTNLVKIKTWASLYTLANSVWFSMNCLVLSIFYIGILIYSYGCVNSLYILDVNVLLFWLF